MTPEQKQSVIKFRKQKLGYKRIADRIEGVNRDNVRDFIKTKWFEDNYSELVKLENYKSVDYSNIEKDYGTGVCEYCGEKYSKKAGHQKYCSDNCRNKGNYEPVKKIIKFCEFCGKEYKATKVNQKYCSNECSYKINYKANYKTKPLIEQICRYCGKAFMPEKSNNQKFCSEKCFIDHRKKYKENLYRHNCEWCGENFNSGNKNQKYCSKECLTDWQNSSGYIKTLKENTSLVRCCPECGRVFKPVSVKNIYCSRACSNRSDSRNSNANKVKLLKNNGKYNKNISLTKLIKRDNGKCKICGKFIDENDRRINKDEYNITGKNYPSIDHIIPANKGGTHTWDNVQLTHHYCNSVKSDNL